MAVTQLSSGPDTLLVEATFPSAAPLMTFQHWIEPGLLMQWWPAEAEVEPYIGGRYHFSWPQNDWHLRGSYLAFEPSRRLAFTWRWDHDAADEATREVHVSLAPFSTQGTRLLLTHGPYEDTSVDQEVRLEHHLAGWQHFLARLAGVLA